MESYQLIEVLGGITQIDTKLGYKRIYEINKDAMGYYILFQDIKNLFLQNKEKQYFIDKKDIENIKLIEEYNNKINKYNNDVNDAKDKNRIREVKQKISNDTTNAMAMFYYYENGEEIVAPKKPKLKDLV